MSIAKLEHETASPDGNMRMSRRAAQARGSRTITSCVHGLLREDARSRQEFFALTGVC